MENLRLGLVISTRGRKSKTIFFNIAEIPWLYSIWHLKSFSINIYNYYNYMFTICGVSMWSKVCVCVSICFCGLEMVGGLTFLLFCCSGFTCLLLTPEAHVWGFRVVFTCIVIPRCIKF